MAMITGFFSYSHVDDVHDHLTNLREDIRREFKVQTGDELELFFDRDSIGWGDRWREAIDASIDLASFFIPVLSPSYFHSSACSSELKAYMATVKRMDARQLILPIYYVDLERYRQSSEDHSVDEVLGFQYKDWRNLRFTSRSYYAYEVAIGSIVEALVTANDEIAEVTNSIGDTDGQPSGARAFAGAKSSIAGKSLGEINMTAQPDGTQAVKPEMKNDDDGGFVESMACTQQSLQKLTSTLSGMSGDLDKINNTIITYSDKIKKTNEKKAGAVALVPIMRSMAEDLMPIANDYKSHYDEYAECLYGMDKDVRSVIALINDPEFEFEGSDKFLESVRTLQRTSQAARGGITSSLKAVIRAQKISRELRKPLKIIESASIAFVGSCSVIDGWTELAGQDVSN